MQIERAKRPEEIELKATWLSTWYLARSLPFDGIVYENISSENFDALK